MPRHPDATPPRRRPKGAPRPAESLPTRHPAPAERPRDWNMIGSAVFFGLSLVLLAASLWRFTSPRAKPRPLEQAARRPVDVVNLSRAPTFAAGDLRYQILGLGQDPETGHQVVWIRSITSNRIDGFARKEPLFGGPVRVVAIAPTHVSLEYKGRRTQVEIAP